MCKGDQIGAKIISSELILFLLSVILTTYQCLKFVMFSVGFWLKPDNTIIMQISPTQFALHI